MCALLNHANKHANKRRSNVNSPIGEGTSDRKRGEGRQHTTRQKKETGQARLYSVS